MSFYGYEARPNDYGFVGMAGQQIGAGIAKYGEAKDSENAAKAKAIEDAKKVKLSKEQMNSVYQQVIQKTAKDYSDVTGADEIKSLSWARQHYYPPMEGETPSEFATRLIASGNRVEPELDNVKKQTYFEKSKPTPAAPEQPGAARTAAPIQDARQMDTIATPENARTARLAGQSTGTSMMRGIAQMPGDEPQGLSEPPTPATPEQPKTFQEKQAISDRLGLGGNAEVSKDIQGTRNVQDSEAYIPGMTKSEYAQKVGQGGGDVEGNAARGIYGGLPSDKDIMNNNRLKQAEEIRSKLRMTLAQMEDAKDRATNMDKNTLRLLDTQIRAVQAQIAASKSTSDLAMGIPTGKDYTGQTQFSTGPAWEKEYADAESTYKSATALLDKINSLNTVINPSPADKPQALPTTMTPQEKAAYEWLKNPSSARDPDYISVRDKLSRKYPDLVR